MKQVFVLRSINNASMLMSGQDKFNKPYIVGFTNRVHANKVLHRTCRQQTNYEIVSDKMIDITRYVNEVLVSVNQSTIQNLTVDVEAYFKITSAGKKAKATMILDSINIDEFLLYPFEKRIGIGISEKLLEESHYSLLYDLTLISSCDDITSFIKNLKI